MHCRHSLPRFAYRLLLFVSSRRRLPPPAAPPSTDPPCRPALFSSPLRLPRRGALLLLNSSWSSPPSPRASLFFEHGMIRFVIRRVYLPSPPLGPDPPFFYDRCFCFPSMYLDGLLTLPRGGSRTPNWRYPRSICIDQWNIPRPMSGR